MEVVLCISPAKTAMNSADSWQNHLDCSPWQSSHQLQLLEFLLQLHKISLRSWMSSLLQAAISSAKLPWSNCRAFKKDPLKERAVSVLKVKEKSRMYLCTFFFLLLVLLKLQWSYGLCSVVYVFLHALTNACMGKSNMNWLRCRSLTSLNVCIQEWWENGQLVEWHIVKGKFGKQDIEINRR